MTRTLTAELVDPVPASLGEAPAWDAAGRRLVWVDLDAGLVHSADEAGTRHATWDIGRHVGAALPTAGADLLLVAREGFVRLHPGGRLTPVLDVLGDRPVLRFNDAKCDPAGRAVAGTIAYDAAPAAGTLYRLDPGPRATVLLSGLTVSNGLGWSPAGDRIYHVDTRAGRVSAYAYHDGPLGPALATIPVPSPDGMCVDNDGALWVALFHGGEVRRYTPDGRLDTVVRLPVPHVTSCAFVGDTLFVTTARRDSAVRYAGCLFAVAPGIGGPPAVPWSGAC